MSITCNFTSTTSYDLAIQAGGWRQVQCRESNKSTKKYTWQRATPAFPRALQLLTLLAQACLGLRLLSGSFRAAWFKQWKDSAQQTQTGTVALYDPALWSHFPIVEDPVEAPLFDHLVPPPVEEKILEEQPTLSAALAPTSLKGPSLEGWKTTAPTPMAERSVDTPDLTTPSLGRWVSKQPGTEPASTSLQGPSLERWKTTAPTPVAEQSVDPWIIRQRERWSH